MSIINDSELKEKLTQVYEDVAKKEGLHEEGGDENTPEEVDICESFYNIVPIEKKPSLSELSYTELLSLYKLNKTLYDELSNYIALDNNDNEKKTRRACTTAVRNDILEEIWTRVYDIYSKERRQDNAQED